MRGGSTSWPIDQSINMARRISISSVLFVSLSRVARVHAFLLCVSAPVPLELDVGEGDVGAHQLDAAARGGLERGREEGVVELFLFFLGFKEGAGGSQALCSPG